MNDSEDICIFVVNDSAAVPVCGFALFAPQTVRACMGPGALVASRLLHECLHCYFGHAPRFCTC